MAKMEDHKWFDPECGFNGCQSLVWKGRYESAVKGRSDFRKVYREARELSRGATDALEASRQVVTSLIETEYNVETWGLSGLIAKIDAVLTAIKQEQSR